MDQPKTNKNILPGLLISLSGLLATIAGMTILALDGAKELYLSLCILGVILASAGMIVISMGYGRKKS